MHLRTCTLVSRLDDDNSDALGKEKEKKGRDNCYSGKRYSRERIKDAWGIGLQSCMYPLVLLPRSITARKLERAPLWRTLVIY